MEISGGNENRAEAAKAKYEEGLKGCKEHEKAFFDEPVKECMFKRFDEDNGFCEDFLQKHKTFRRCMEYMMERARKFAPKASRGVLVGDKDFLEWMEDYYRKDDKAEEEKRAKEAAERKKKEEERKKKAAEQKKADKKNPKQAAKKEGRAEEKTAEPPKSKKKLKEMDGQMDMFSLMGM